MGTTEVDIDPSGDVLAVLEESEGPFAPWPSRTAKVGGKGKKRASKREPNFSHVKLSLKHLTLASPRLNSMFSGPWLESTKQSDGLHLWETGDFFDPTAFVIVMNTIHGRNRCVPKTISLDELAKIAVIVDDLQCAEAMETMVDVWLRTTKYDETLPFGRDLILWLLVSQVFSLDSIFLATTRSIMLTSNGQLDNLGLPIRHDIIAEIETRKASMINQVINAVYSAANHWLQGKGNCTFACNSLLLGALIKHLRVLGIHWPAKPTDLSAINYSTLVNSLGKLNSPAVCQSLDMCPPTAYKSPYGPPHATHPCTILKLFAPALKPPSSVSGLTLRSFDRAGKAKKRARII